MTPDQMRQELKMWNNLIPSLTAIIEKLSNFKKLAPTPEALIQEVSKMKLLYNSALKQREHQILRLNFILNEYKEDPIGIGFKLDKFLKTKKVLH